MTKIELIELIRNDMLDSLKRRDSVDAVVCSEPYGYYNGQFRAYENVVRLLTMFEVEEVASIDTRFMRP